MGCQRPKTRPISLTLRLPPQFHFLPVILDKNALRPEEYPIPLSTDHSHATPTPDLSRPLENRYASLDRNLPSRWELPPQIGVIDAQSDDEPLTANHTINTPPIVTNQP